jgi:hypothetical protein
VHAAIGSDAECRPFLERGKDELRRQRLATLELRSRDSAHLVRAGHAIHLPAVTTPEGGMRFGTDDRARVWAVPSETGLRLVGHEDALRALVMTSSALRTREFLEARGYQVDSAPAPTGELTLVARNRETKTVSVSVARTGATTVDTSGFSGRACEALVRDLSVALEGTITRFCPKPEYYNAPTVRAGQTGHA